MVMVYTVREPRHELKYGAPVGTHDHVECFCTCGWRSYTRFSVSVAMSLFRRHLEDMEVAKGAVDRRYEADPGTPCGK